MSYQAENQANVKFSYKKYYALRGSINHSFPEKFYSDMQTEQVAQTLKFGDTQPAVVVSTEPLLVAAYSDEMDAVVMLKFPSELSETYSLTPGTRLTTSCRYWIENSCAPDIFPGDGFSRQFTDFTAVVQLFLGKGDDKLRAKTDLFGESTWARVAALAAEYRSAHPDLTRDGFHYFKKASKA